MPQVRVQINPELAVAVLAAGANPETCRVIPSWILPLVGEPAGCSVPPEAVYVLERWLCVTRGSEFRKAKTFEAAMRAAAHVTCLWQEAGEQEVESRKREKERTC